MMLQFYGFQKARCQQQIVTIQHSFDALNSKMVVIELDFMYYCLKLQLHDAIYRLRFYSNSLIHILSLSNWHNNVALIQKNRGDKSHRVIVALICLKQRGGQLSSFAGKAEHSKA